MGIFFIIFRKLVRKQQRWLFMLQYSNINNHCIKSVPIRSYSGPYFHPMGLNTDENNSECGHFLRSKSPLFFQSSFLPWIELCIFEIVAYIFNMPSIWLTMLIGTSFEINLETLRRRITCSTSIHGFAIFFFFVICEGSIWLDPRFNGGTATWIIFSEFSWITVMFSFFVKI